MIDSNAIRQFVENYIRPMGLFVVDVTVSKDNDITVTLDGPSGVDIDTCASLSRLIEEEFPREPEDYSLEVGGAGLTAPFKVLGQYLKNVGNQIEVITKDQRKLKCKLLEADDEGILVEYPVKTKVEGQKKPVVEDHQERILLSDIREAHLLLDF